ncbi:MAG TPA: LPS assembly protein LptD [Thermoanaerobaculia bacterium]|jgi:lipopolysaccharide assembly outer membrane protein LptD (OstA)|nr:LPS assembly protein LptD [Thermoanaerobaculia bacterium]
MLANRSTPPAPLLALCLCLASPAAAQETPQPPTTPPPAEQPAAPTTQPQGPVEPVAPPAPTGAQPSGPPQTTAAPATPPQPAGPPGAGPGRLDFQLKFTDAHGGGSAAGSAANLEYKREDYAVLTGGVQIRYQDIDLKADQAEIDLETKIVTARGNVILDQGPRRLTGDDLTFDLNTKTGKLNHATGQVSPDYYFTGTEVAKTGDDTYLVTNGIFTSCSQKTPDWSFRLRRATVEVEGYAHVQSASMRVKKLPVFYTPYILWPVKSERSSGFLIPNVGYSDRRGASLGLAYFQTLGRSYDTTFHVDLYSQNFLGFGNEFRYQPTAGTKGDLLGYYVRDSEIDDWRWKLEWNHTTDDLPWGMRGVVQYSDYSDFNFFRDFERSFDRNTLRFIDSRGFVTGNWGPHLLNILASSREAFVTLDQTIEQRRLPEVEYRLRSTRLARTPFYLQLQSSLDYFDISRPNSYSGTYGRADLFPQVTLPIRTFPWLSLSVTGGERLTWYGDTLDATQKAFSGESLTRAFPTANADIVGPSFSRIFDRKIGGFAKFKHVIEPRWTYTYTGEIDDADASSVPLFDEVDTPRSTNVGRLALDQRILGKPDKENGVAREVLFFELARNYSFDDTQPLQFSADRQVTTSEGPIEALLRFNPTDRITLKMEADYDTLFSGITSTGLTGNYGFGAGNYLGATWFTRSRPETGESLSNQVRLNGALNLTSWRLHLEGQLNYDFEEKLLQQQTLVMNYTSQCYGLRLELRDFRAGTGPRTRDKDIRFSLTLKNVGTFLDLNSRSTTVEP